MRLQYRIALATFIPLIVLVVLGGALGAYALRRIPEDLALRRQLALTEVAAAGVAGTLKGYVQLLEGTADELGDFTGDAIQQQEILQGRAGLLSPFSGGVGLLDAQGTPIAGTGPALSSLNLDVAFRPYFQEVLATDAPVFSTAFRDYPSGFDSVVIAVPIRHNGAFVGVLLGALDLTRREWVRDLNLLQSSNGLIACLIDSTSTIIYHPDASQIGGSIQADPQLWHMVIDGKPKSALLRPAGSGQSMVVTFTPLPGIAWGLITESSWEEIVAPVVSYQWAVAGLMFVGIIAALIALVFSIRRVTRPLNALVAAGQRAAEGKPYEPLTPEGPPDLRTLIAVINRMVARLTEQQAALRQYALQVVKGQEDERLRISHDLHDETVQELIGLAQRLELSVAALEENPVAAKTRLQEARDLTQRVLAGVRRISHDLRPSTLEDLGLASALQVLTRELGERLPGVHVHCEIVGREVRLSPELELAAFRIAQEALNNVRKHAKQATRVNVALVFEDWGIVLEVEDDGCGFDVPDRDALVVGGHLGLVGILERAQLFGGELSITSAPGEGTTLSVRLPCVVGEEPTSPHALNA